jgi:LmbE family N-acetylglucosaminyl deacetylase
MITVYVYDYRVRQLKTKHDLRQLGDVLFVGAHPDDEVFAAGGILAACAQAGQRVGCVIATRGEEGLKDEKRWPYARLGEIRTRETEESLEVLGVSELRWLGYRDGDCAELDPAEAASKLWQEIDRFRPDTILTFGPDGQTGHPDHKTVSLWTMRATKGMKVRVLWIATEKEQYEQMREVDEAANIFFKVDQPPLVASGDCVIDFRLPEDLTKVKRRAFEAVESQFEGILGARPFERPGEGLARECFVEAKGGQNG